LQLQRWACRLWASTRKHEPKQFGKRHSSRWLKVKSIKEAARRSGFPWKCLEPTGNHHTSTLDRTLVRSIKWFPFTSFH
jgi:hypothetical protein